MELGICTTETAYGISLMNVINSKDSAPFMARFFTKGSNLAENVKDYKIDIMLISPEFYTEELHALLPQGLFLFDDGGGIMGRIADVPYIDQYQSVESMLRLIIGQYGDTGRNILKEEGKTTLVGIYSPVHRIGKTAFSLSIAQELSERFRTLMINLEEFSGFSSHLYEDCETDLTEVVYAAYQDGQLLESTLPMFVKKYQDLDYIPPARIPIQIMEPGTETGGGWKGDWRDFVSKIAGTGLYEAIVIDMGDSIRGMLELLAACDRLYVPMSGDSVAESKLKQFEVVLEELGYPEILEKARIVRLPESEEVSGSTLYVGEFVWGPINQVARQMVSEDLYGIAGRNL